MANEDVKAKREQLMKTINNERLAPQIRQAAQQQLDQLNGGEEIQRIDHFYSQAKQLSELD